MDAKEYLSQIGKIQKRIKCLTEQLRFMRDASECVTSVISDMPKAATRNIHRLEDSVIRISELEDKLSQELDKLAEANRFICCLPDPQWQDVIIKRYLNKMMWDEITSEIDLSSRQTYRIHGLALDFLDKLLADGSEWQSVAVDGS